MYLLCIKVYSVVVSVLASWASSATSPSTTTETEQVLSVTDAPKVDVATGELAQEVALNPMAKDFSERKAELKELLNECV
jgi:hypothetical protein